MDRNINDVIITTTKKLNCDEKTSIFIIEQKIQKKLKLMGLNVGKIKIQEKDNNNV